ncbi:hypothetical protein ACHAWF_006563 [Thalassiosira exigua]
MTEVQCQSLPITRQLQASLNHVGGGPMTTATATTTWHRNGAMAQSSERATNGTMATTTTMASATTTTPPGVGRRRSAAFVLLLALLAALSVAAAASEDVCSESSDAGAGDSTCARGSGGTAATTTRSSSPSSSSSSSSADPVRPINPASCRLFLAPRSRAALPGGDDGDGSGDDGDGRAADPSSSERRLGMFSSRPLPKGSYLSPRSGDLVLHLIDVDPDASPQLSKWLARGYLAEARDSGHGGNYEGLGRIWTALPGTGTLASAPSLPPLRPSDGSDGPDGLRTIDPRPNVWASVPENDEAGSARFRSPAAGSFAHDHNLTYVVTRPEGVAAGGEVRADRTGWHRRAALRSGGGGAREEAGKNATALKAEEKDAGARWYDPERLFEEGLCLDNMYADKSPNGYGRGALASRSLPKGSIVAPVPVLPVPRDELRYLRSKERKKVMSYRTKLRKQLEEEGRSSEEIEEEAKEAMPPDVRWRRQLMLNYCYGHRNSSVLMFPYGKVASYVNHAPSVAEGDDPVANVALRWSETLMKRLAGDGSSAGSYVDLRTLTPAQLWERPSPEGLVLELVALRDLRPDEEVLMDYGNGWIEAWDAHAERWDADPKNQRDDDEENEEAVRKRGDEEDRYTPAYIMEEAVMNLRTAEEQAAIPYPENVFTACFHRYRREEDDGRRRRAPSAVGEAEAIPWKMSPGLFDLRNLRPCRVVSRDSIEDRYGGTGDHHPHAGPSLYSAVVGNAPGAPSEERIPKGEKVIVAGMPRGVFRFVDRPYSGDAHLDGAFRREAGLEEGGVYPEAWLDLA